MSTLSAILRMTTAVCAVLAVTGCITFPAHRGETYPPPRGPAPGYHQEYRRHDLPTMPTWAFT